MEARQRLLAQVVVVTQQTPAPAYTTVVVSHDHAGLQCHGRFHLPVPPQMLRSSLPSVSRGLVYINTPGRTCLHELFIEYEQVTAWVARFSSNKIGGKLSCIISRRLHLMAQWAGAQVAATTVWLTSNNQLEGTIGRDADTVHTGSFITRRSHLNLLWVHIALSTPIIYTFCYGQIRRISRQHLKSS